MFMICQWLFFIAFHLETLFISCDEFVVLVTLHVVLNILIESRTVEGLVL